MRTIEIQGQEHASVHDAIVELNFTGDHAISIGGRYFTVSEAEYRRLQDEGIQPTTWHDVEHHGEYRTVSVPGNV